MTNRRYLATSLLPALPSACMESVWNGLPISYNFSMATNLVRACQFQVKILDFTFSHAKSEDI
jgi:hypothetical protein